MHMQSKETWVQLLLLEPIVRKRIPSLLEITEMDPLLLASLTRINETKIERILNLIKEIYTDISKRSCILCGKRAYSVVEGWFIDPIRKPVMLELKEIIPLCKKHYSKLNSVLIEMTRKRYDKAAKKLVGLIGVKKDESIEIIKNLASMESIISNNTYVKVVLSALRGSIPYIGLLENFMEKIANRVIVMQNGFLEIPNILLYRNYLIYSLYSDLRTICSSRIRIGELEKGSKIIGMNLRVIRSQLEKHMLNLSRNASFCSGIGEAIEYLSGAWVLETSNRRLRALIVEYIAAHIGKRFQPFTRIITPYRANEKPIIYFFIPSFIDEDIVLKSLLEIKQIVEGIKEDHKQIILRFHPVDPFDYTKLANYYIYETFI